MARHCERRIGDAVQGARGPCGGRPATDDVRAAREPRPAVGGETTMQWRVAASAASVTPSEVQSANAAISPLRKAFASLATHVRLGALESAPPRFEPIMRVRGEVRQEADRRASSGESLLATIPVSLRLAVAPVPRSMAGIVSPSDIQTAVVAGVPSGRGATVAPVTIPMRSWSGGTPSSIALRREVRPADVPRNLVQPAGPDTVPSAGFVDQLFERGRRATPLAGLELRRLPGAASQGAAPASSARPSDPPEPIRPVSSTPAR